MARSATALLARCIGAALLAFGLIAPVAAAGDEALWKLLQGGGQVVLIRHAVTQPGVGDPEGMRLDDCATQRNLSEEGRAHARRIGEAFRSHGIAIGRVLSSPWCRCLETARLAFGTAPETTSALGNLFGRPERQGAQLAQLQQLIDAPARGNTVMVSHGSTIQALTGVSPATGEVVVLQPRGPGRFALAGRLSVP